MGGIYEVGELRYLKITFLYALTFLSPQPHTDARVGGSDLDQGGISKLL